MCVTFHGSGYFISSVSDLSRAEHELKHNFGSGDRPVTLRAERCGLIARGIEAVAGPLGSKARTSVWMADGGRSSELIFTLRYLAGTTSSVAGRRRHMGVNIKA